MKRYRIKLGKRKNEKTKWDLTGNKEVKETAKIANK
jgi:hypothetical protein